MNNNLIKLHIKQVYFFNIDSKNIDIEDSYIVLLVTIPTLRVKSCVRGSIYIYMLICAIQWNIKEVANPVNEITDEFIFVINNNL